MQIFHFAKVHKCFFVDREPCGSAPRAISDHTNKPSRLHLAQTKHSPVPHPPHSLFPSSQNFLLAFSFTSSVFSSICPVHCCQASSSLVRMFPSSFFFVLESCVWFLNFPTSPRLIPPSPWLALDVTVYHLPVYLHNIQDGKSLCNLLTRAKSPPHPLCIENFVRCCPPTPEPSSLRSPGEGGWVSAEPEKTMLSLRVDKASFVGFSTQEKDALFLEPSSV